MELSTKVEKCRWWLTQMVWRPTTVVSSVLVPARPECPPRPGRDTTRAHHHHQESRTAGGDLNEMTDLGNYTQRRDPITGTWLHFCGPTFLSAGRLVMISLPRWPVIALLPRASQDCQELQCCSTVQSYCRARCPVSQHEEGPWHHCHRSASTFSLRGHRMAGRGELSLQMGPQLRGAAKPQL